MDLRKKVSWPIDPEIWKRPLVVLCILLAAVLFNFFLGSASATVSITFLGAAREVGGSCHLVTAGKTRFLVDCGSLGKAGKEGLPEDPASLSFVLLTHAHSDHCGLIPELYELGFDGEVFCTEATSEIIPIMWRMGRSFSKEKVSKASFDESIEKISAVPFDTIIEKNAVSFRFRRAGHLLGAAFIEIWIADDPDTVKVVFSGDLGSGASLLIPPLEYCSGADFVIMESTYGSTVRDSVKGGGKDPASVGAGTGASNIFRHDEFAGAVGETLKNGGDVLIPAFTLGRTQEVIAALDLYHSNGTIPAGTLVYTDSPTAKKISDIYRSREEDLSGWARRFYSGRILHSNRLREVKSRTSMKVHERSHEPAIFISSSGDLDHANSPRHLMKMFDDPRNLVCIVGWQPPWSVGNRIVSGKDPVLIKYSMGRKHNREWISPLLQAMKVSSFSAHADQEGLVRWLSSISGVRKVFLVHGEYENSRALAVRIEDELGIDTGIPRRGETAVLARGAAKDLLNRSLGKQNRMNKADGNQISDRQADEER
ncbi:MAG: MBL fold metallo-hydrolase [Candidatus Krumholzibacteriota bacterium]|nr:MBL fold metallo-hydrolase [Candidatus Krumholzibacteriota bacterium]